YAKGVTWGDYDDDGDPDLYVSNLWGPNRLYRNEGDGSFRELAGQLGVDGPLMSFATWFFDYDNDGDLDLYVAAYVEQVPASVASYFGKEVRGARNHLYRNEGNGTFAEVAAELGLTRLVTTMGAGFGDLDQDGWLDFYLGTGYPAYEALLPNVMYRNDRGRHFVDVTYSGGFGHLQKGHAIAFADLDDDGDQDVFEQMGGAYRGDLAYDKLYENPGFAGRHTVTLKLEGRTSNRCAIGARVTIRVDEGGRTRAIHRMVGPRGSFGSGPLRLEVGLGDATSIREIEVRWPGGGRPQVVRDLHVDRLYHIREGEDLPREASRRTFVMPR
ncbi:MAG: CRTAC1 family protein, partial [Planctomycetes bacterium]|nr:CRTAC1 family protein [Planctomycetota bacterium]